MTIRSENQISSLLTRNIFLACQLLTLQLLVLQPAVLLGQASSNERGAVEVTPAALAIHQDGYVFDGHNDLPWQVRTVASRSFDALDISKPQPQIHTDIGRLRAGGVGAQYWSVYVPASSAESGLSHQMTLEQIEIVHAMMERYPETFELALGANDIERIRARQDRVPYWRRRWALD